MRNLDPSQQPTASIPQDESRSEYVAGEFSIRNEFATVTVRKVVSRNGERLQITSPFFNSTVLLDALQVEGLTWQEPEFFSFLLRGSIGPVPVESSDVVPTRPAPGQPESRRDDDS